MDNEKFDLLDEEQDDAILQEDKTDPVAEDSGYWDCDYNYKCPECGFKGSAKELEYNGNLCCKKYIARTKKSLR